MRRLRWRGRGRKVPFLTNEWCDLWRTVASGVPGLEGATADFEVTVVQDTGRTQSFTAKLVDGETTGVVCGPTPGAHVRAEFPQAEFARYLSGDTRPVYDAYWTGGITVTGDLDAVVAITPLLDSPVFKAQLRRVHDQTAFA